MATAADDAGRHAPRSMSDRTSRAFGILVAFCVAMFLLGVAAGALLS